MRRFRKGGWAHEWLCCHPLPKETFDRSIDEEVEKLTAATPAEGETSDRGNEHPMRFSTRFYLFSPVAIMAWVIWSYIPR